MLSFEISPFAFPPRRRRYWAALNALTQKVFLFIQMKPLKPRLKYLTYTAGGTYFRNHLNDAHHLPQVRHTQGMGWLATALLRI
jgi:hypothetical protein